MVSTLVTSRLISTIKRIRSGVMILTSLQNNYIKSPDPPSNNYQYFFGGAILNIQASIALTYIVGSWVSHWGLGFGAFVLRVWGFGVFGGLT